MSHQLETGIPEKVSAKASFDKRKGSHLKRTLKDLQIILGLRENRPQDSSIPLPPRHLLSKKGIQVLEKHSMEAGQLVATNLMIFI